MRSAGIQTAIRMAGMVFLMILVGPLSNLSSARADVVPIYKVYLATRLGDSYQRSKDHQFGCDDSIYLFLESSDPQLADAVLETEWISLESDARHRTNKPFARQTSGKRRYWSWGGISFEGGSAGPLGAISSLMDPVSGREKFIGRWKIEVSVAGFYKKMLEMTVLC